jgi:hypothetical protein
LLRGTWEGSWIIKKVGLGLGHADIIAAQGLI